MLNLDNYEVLTFDCYGTLIDWESGIISGLQPILKNHDIDLSDAEILTHFAEFEPQIQQGKYITYRQVLQGVVSKFGERFGFVPSEEEMNSLPESLKQWRPFPDTVPALKLLQKKLKLAIISNIDDDLFAYSQNYLETDFDWIITAQQVKSYKPSLNNFRLALEKIDLPKSKILHVGASVYHDIVPANFLGIATVWVNRKKDDRSLSATLPAKGKPDWEVLDLAGLCK